MLPTPDLTWKLSHVLGCWRAVRALSESEQRIGRPKKTSGLAAFLWEPVMSHGAYQTMLPRRHCYSHQALTKTLVHMGGCQNYGPFLGPQYSRAPSISGTQKKTIVLTTTHIVLFLFGASQPLESRCGASLVGHPRAGYRTSAGAMAMAGGRTTGAYGLGQGFLYIHVYKYMYAYMHMF